MVGRLEYTLPLPCEQTAPATDAFRLHCKGNKNFSNYNEKKGKSFDLPSFFFT